MLLHRLASRSLFTAARSIHNNASRPTMAAALQLQNYDYTFPPSASSHRFSSTAAAAHKNKNPDMMCRQCEQTQDHVACTTVGVCGKSPETSVSEHMMCTKVYNFVHIAHILLHIFYLLDRPIIRLCKTY